MECLGGGSRFTFPNPNQTYLKLFVQVKSYCILYSPGVADTICYTIKVETSQRTYWSVLRSFTQFKELYLVLKEEYTFDGFNTLVFSDERGVQDRQTEEALDQFCQAMVGLLPFPQLVEDFLHPSTT